MFPVAADNNCTADSCMIVVDSGSTGSRAHLYQYTFSKGNTPVVIKEKMVKKMSTGLASLGDDKEKTSLYLSRLFSDFKQNNSNTLPVYYYSTAGMRLLPEDKQTSIYQNVTQWFNTQSNLELKVLKTISGQEEGVFGWLAVNYIAGTFSDSTEHKRIGMMDFGGASIQIALPVNKTDTLNDALITRIQVSNKTYKIYSQSFLGIGINELTHQFLNDEHCFAERFPLPSGALGKGDAVKCEQDIEVLTNKLHKVSQIKDKAIIQGVDKWFALGALEGLSHSKPFESLASPLTINEVLMLGQKGACQVNWQALKASSPEDTYLYNTCLASAYYYAIIIKGYGLSESELIDTAAANSEKSLDWTYGVVITHH